MTMAFCCLPLPLLSIRENDYKNSLHAVCPKTTHTAYIQKKKWASKGQLSACCTLTAMLCVVIFGCTHCMQTVKFNHFFSYRTGHCTSTINPNLTTGFTGLVGKVRKKTISRRRKEGRVEKKSARSAPAGPGARTRDLPRARRGSPAARHGGCLDKQAFPCL